MENNNRSLDGQKTAIVFPGQGAQFTGMGRELYEKSPAARRIFDLAESLRKGTVSQCFEGSKEELSLTVNTQPCIFTVSLASAYALLEQGVTADAVAGFSLGELSALTYAGVFTFEDGFKAICKRAALMHEAATKQKGSMVAVLKLSAAAVLKLCGEYGVFAVNFNCPGQIVVSGGSEAITGFSGAVTAAGGRAIPLAVSGAFHSPMMADAAAEFERYLGSVNVSAPKMPVYANLTACPYEDDIKKTLGMQIKNPVLWEQTVRNMLSESITEFVEAEPGKVLSGLISKTKEAAGNA